MWRLQKIRASLYVSSEVLDISKFLNIYMKWTEEKLFNQSCYSQIRSKLSK